MPPSERGNSVLSNHLLPVMPGIKRMRSALTSPPSVIKLFLVKDFILWPRCVFISRFFISSCNPCTARGPSRAPGFEAGVKKTISNLSLRFSLRSCSSIPNKNSNMGPPRMAEGSLGLPEKPMAMVPLCKSLKRSRIFSLAGMPSQGVMTCSIPGSFFIKRPPDAIIKPSFLISPESVTTIRPASFRPVAIPW